jgi:hypothetical protein
MYKELLCPTLKKVTNFLNEQEFELAFLQRRYANGQ